MLLDARTSLKRKAHLQCIYARDILYFETKYQLAIFMFYNNRLNHQKSQNDEEKNHRGENIFGAHISIVYWSNNILLLL